MSCRGGGGAGGGTSGNLILKFNQGQEEEEEEEEEEGKKKHVPESPVGRGRDLFCGYTSNHLVKRKACMAVAGE